MKSNQSKDFRELLEGFETAVLITSEGEGLHARPMAVADVDDNCDLWFITGDKTAKVREIARESRVQVVCQNGWRSCVSISGYASIVKDGAKIRELWKASYRTWFPEGADDPGIVLIHVRGEHAEYWDNNGVNALSYAYQAIKAVATGRTPEVKEGEQHGYVSLGAGGAPHSTVQ